MEMTLSCRYLLPPSLRPHRLASHSPRHSMTYYHRHRGASIVALLCAVSKRGGAPWRSLLSRAFLGSANINVTLRRHSTSRRPSYRQAAEMLSPLLKPSVPWLSNCVKRNITTCAANEAIILLRELAPAKAARLSTMTATTIALLLHSLALNSA